MATSTTYSKQQILEMIMKKSPLITFVKPKHAKSVKWNNYLQIYVNGYAQSFISCVKCHCVLSWRSHDGTNVMEKHDKGCKQQLSPSAQQSIESFYSSNKISKKLINSTKRKLTNTLAECCSIDGLPFSFVNGDGFKELAQDLIKAGRQLGSNVSIDELLPDATTISREIDKIYDLRKQQLMSYLANINHFVITVDFWTEKRTKVHYGGVTLHAYSEEHGLLVFVLACKPYELPSQSADNVRLFTDAILESYGLPLDKVKYVVSDNENKMRASFRSNIIRIGCSAHFVNKIIEHALCLPNIDCDDIQRLFNDIHDIVVYLRSCHNQTKLSKKLQLFSKTRWNSAYVMISCFIDVFPELNGIITDKVRKSILAGIDFDELLAFAKYLKHFVDATELLSAEKTPTIQLVLPFKQRLMKLSKPDDNDPESLKKFKKYFENQIPTYWELEDVHYVAAVLHPNLKHLQICSNKDKKKAYDLIKKEINKRCSGSTIALDGLESPSFQKTSMSSIDSDNFLYECFDQTSTTAPVANIYDELKRYLQSTDQLKDDDEDLLTFWKRQKIFYPILYSIACDILVIPATNTSAERLFSTSGNTITDTRTRLAAMKVNKLMFIKKNLTILKQLFHKNETPNNYDSHVDVVVQKGEKRSREDLSSDDDTDIVNLIDCNNNDDE